MTLSIPMILGAIAAIIVLYLLVRFLFKVLADFAVPVHPALITVAWFLQALFVVVALCWAFGISIPFFNISLT